MIEEILPGIRQFDLTGKSAVITGGSRGLGYAMAAGLASAGANLMIVNRNPEEGKLAAQQLEKDYGTHVVFHTADITMESAANGMAEAAHNVFGKIDILINSAGINIRGPIDELSFDEFNKVMNVNVNGTWLSCRAVTPFMKKTGAGKIINLASTLGVIGLANRTPYTASKGAVVNLTRALAIELAPFNINVNAICPGPFLTAMNIPIRDSDDARNIVLGATALGRWAELKEIQGAAIFMASEAASYMVGSILAVDGGWTAK